MNKMEKKSGFREFLCSKGGKIGMIVVLYAIIYLLVMVTIPLFESMTYGWVIYLLVFGFFGWKSLNKITPDIFLFMPIIGWVIFFVVKGILSVVVGLFTTPYYLGKKLAEFIQAKLSE